MRIILTMLLSIAFYAHGQIINGSRPYTPNLLFLPYRYYGWVNINTPTDATIKTLNKDLINKMPLTVLNTIPTGSQYYVYYYPLSYGAINNIIVNNFDFTDAFTITSITFNNIPYYKIVSNNKMKLKTTFIFQ
jgi:hypothetical protein